MTAAVTLLLAAGAVLGLARLGDLARRHLGPRDRYQFSFAQIECDAPPGKDRGAFLSEVRYVSSSPDAIQLLDPDFATKLTAAFAVHPWVESVEGIDVDPSPRVSVRLVFRTPMLIVKLRTGGTRAVDRNGILLPLCGIPAGVPELVTPVPEPDVAAGTLWSDPIVRRAVELVKTYRPHQLEKSAAGWKLTDSDGKVLTVAG